MKNGIEHRVKGRIETLLERASRKRLRSEQRNKHPVERLYIYTILSGRMSSDSFISNLNHLCSTILNSTYVVDGYTIMFHYNGMLQLPLSNISMVTQFD